MHVLAALLVLGVIFYLITRDNTEANKAKRKKLHRQFITRNSEMSFQIIGDEISTIVVQSTWDTICESKLDLTERAQELLVCYIAMMRFAFYLMIQNSTTTVSQPRIYRIRKIASEMTVLNFNERLGEHYDSKYLAKEYDKQTRSLTSTYNKKQNHNPYWHLSKKLTEYLGFSDPSGQIAMGLLWSNQILTYYDSFTSILNKYDSEYTLIDEEM